MTAAADAARAQAAALSCWKGPVDPQPLAGDATCRRLQVSDGDARFLVRLGGDAPAEGYRFANHLAAAEAAAAAGIAPEVMYHEPGVLVTRAVAGRSFEPADLKLPGYRREITDLIATCHHEGAKRLRGPSLIFWPPHAIRAKLRLLEAGEGRHRTVLADLRKKAQAIEAAIGPVEPVFAHNDLRANSFVDDGKRLWLVDWDHAAFGAPLFDLANLAVESDFGGEDEEWLLGFYHQRIPDAALWRRYRVMVCAALLHAALRAMVLERSDPAGSQSAVAGENLERFERAYEAFANMMEIAP